MIAFVAITFESYRKERAERINEIETTFELNENQAVIDNLNQDANDVLDVAAARTNLLGSNGAINPCGTLSLNWLGTCDNQATISIDGRPARIITLK